MGIGLGSPKTPYSDQKAEKLAFFLLSILTVYLTLFFLSFVTPVTIKQAKTRLRMGFRWQNNDLQIYNLVMLTHRMS